MSDRLVKFAILIGVLATFVGLPLAALLWLTAVPGVSFAGALPPLNAAERAAAERMRTDIAMIAATPHNLMRPAALERVAATIERELAAAGYRVSRQPFEVGGQQVRNIEATIEPSADCAATLVIGAHYDSNHDAPGANDNASGTAAVLELARQLADLRGRSAMRIRLVLFVNEEPPFFQTDKMGSLVYARLLRSRGERVAGMLSLETLGYFSDAPNSQYYPFPLSALYPSTGNFVAFVGLTSSRPLVRRTVRDFRALARFPSVGGTAPALIQGIDWSDHWSFEQVGYPALMVTDTAPFRYPHYHRRSDTIDKVDLARLARVVGGLSRVVRRWATTSPLAE